MKIKRALFLFLLMFATGLSSLCAAAKRDDVWERLRQFLDGYSHKDLAGVMDMVAGGDVLVMGSDLKEVCTSQAQVEGLLRDDFKLWHSSSFGKIEMLSTQRSGTLITAFFDVPFTFRRGKSEQTVVVRFATVWKRSSRGLLLVQSANSTPTVGQSAKELLGRN